MVETATPEIRPFSWAAVLGWALSLALGLAVTALGHLPALAFADYRALQPLDYGNDWLLVGQMMLAALAGGIVVAAVQWRILVAQSAPAARQWFRWTIVGWVFGWVMVLLNSYSFVILRLHQTHIFAENSSLVLAFATWLWPGLHTTNLQNAALLKAGIKRPLRLLFDLTGWALGALLYAVLLAQSDGSLIAAVLVALPVGAFIGLLSGLGLRFGPAFGAWTDRMQQRFMGPPPVAPPGPVTLRPLAPLWWAVALALGFLITALPRLWLVYTNSATGKTSDLWTYGATWGLLGAVLGGAVLGLIQAAVLRRHGDPAARGWAAVTVLAWLGQWAMTTLLQFPFADHYPYSLPRAELMDHLSWFAGGVTFGLIQAGVLRRPAWNGAWAVAMGILWAGTGLLYSIVFLRPLTDLGSLVLASLAVGGVIGVLSGLILSYVLAYAPPAWLQALERAPARPVSDAPVARLYPLGSGVVWMIGVALIALILLLDIQVCSGGRCLAAIPVGPAVAWTEQLRVAQDAARVIDPAAVLLSVDGSPLLDHRASGDAVPLAVTFQFYSAAGRARQGEYGHGNIAVGFVDTAPTATLRIDPDHYSSSGYEADITHAPDRLALVRLAPREALALVVAARQVAVAGSSDADALSMYGPVLLLDSPNGPVWRVSYGNPYPMDFLVDVQTGAVTHHATP